MTETIDLPFADGSMLHVTLRGGDAWPNHVHLRIRGATDVDLGNLDINRYVANLHAWVSGETQAESTVQLNEIDVVWIANLSPHKHVLYGSAGLSTEHLIVIDALIAPPKVVAHLQLDDHCKQAWIAHFASV